MVIRSCVPSRRCHGVETRAAVRECRMGRRDGGRVGVYEHPGLLVFVVLAHPRQVSYGLEDMRRYGLTMEEADQEASVSKSTSYWWLISGNEKRFV